MRHFIAGSGVSYPEGQIDVGPGYAFISQRFGGYVGSGFMWGWIGEGSRKTISLHTFRHTTAVHLLRSDVAINTVRAWLGHGSLDTPHIYAEVDLEMKAKALSHFDLPRLPPQKRKRQDPDTLNFLRGL